MDKRMHWRVGAHLVTARHDNAPPLPGSRTPNNLHTAFLEAHEVVRHRLASTPDFGFVY